MRYLLFPILIGIFIVNTGYSQNIKKILAKDELKQLETNDTLYKRINNLDFDEGFTGTLLVKKKDGNIKSIEIGTWIRKDSKHGNNAIMVWDSVGRLTDYKEFNKNKTVSFDCKYWYETVNGKYYRLEKMLINDENGNTFIKGFRYWQIKVDNFGFYYQLQKHKFGKWEYYDDTGSLIKIKNHGEIK